MTKNANLDTANFADAIVDVVDDIRREIHGALHTRPWKVEVVTRRWSGDVAGVGTPTVSVLELDPVPKVRRNTRDRMGPAGREPAGSYTITNVSLRYTQDELQPRVDPRTEVGYRLTENQGHRQHEVWGVLCADPVARHGDDASDDIDWYLVLNETTPMTNLDGVDAP